MENEHRPFFYLSFNIFYFLSLGGRENPTEGNYMDGTPKSENCQT